MSKKSETSRISTSPLPQQSNTNSTPKFTTPCKASATRIKKIEEHDFEVEIKVLDMRDPSDLDPEVLRSETGNTLEIFIVKGEIHKVNGCSYRVFQGDGEVWGFSEDTTDVAKAIHLGVLRIMKRERDVP